MEAKCRNCLFWAYTGRTGDCLATTTRHGENLAHLIIYSRASESSMWIETPTENLIMPTLRSDADFSCAHHDPLGYDIIERSQESDE